MVSPSLPRPIAKGRGIEEVRAYLLPSQALKIPRSAARTVSRRSRRRTDGAARTFSAASVAATTSGVMPPNSRRVERLDDIVKHGSPSTMMRVAVHANDAGAR